MPRPVPVDAAKDKLVLDPLSKGFVLSKPIQQGYDPAIIYRLENEGHLIITRKRDGFKALAVNCRGKIRIYTDGINDITDYLPHVVEELVGIKEFENKILVGELVATKYDDDLGYVNSILKSKIERALELQKERPLHFIAFAIVGKRVSHYCDQRADFEIFQVSWCRYVHGVHVIGWPSGVPLPFDDAKELAIKEGWEGLVLYDTEFRYSYRLDGEEPERVPGCYKWKPLHEDDFIIRKWFASPQDPNRLKDVLLTQRNSRGREFNCGKFGGFSRVVREEIQRRLGCAADTYSCTPVVVQMQYETRYPSGKLRTPIFLRVRDDKQPKNCRTNGKFQRDKIEYVC